MPIGSHTAEMGDLERAVLAAVDDDEIVADLQALVRVPSVDGSPSEHEAVRWCANRLDALGMRVDSWEVDVASLSAVDGFPGMEVPRDRISGCVGTTGARDEDPALVLCGHVDVVPPGDFDRWTERDPFSGRIVDGVLLGRGSCDMKAGIAAVIGAVAAVRRSGVSLSRGLAVHPVMAEEDGGAGAFATLQRGHHGDACVIAEPTEGQVIPANAGSLTFRLTVRGLAAHGSTRTRGTSAVEKFEQVHAVLRRLEERRNTDPDPLFAHLDLAAPLSVGSVRSGDWASTVPDLLVAEGRYGVLPGETVEQARSALQDAVAEACAEDDWLRDHPVEVTWPGGVFASARLPDGHPLLGQVRRAAVDAGAPAEPAVRGGPYGSDLRLYTAAGMPTVQYGPGDVRFAHVVDEQVAIADVLHCARVYALLVLRRCG